MFDRESICQMLASEDSPHLAEVARLATIEPEVLDVLREGITSKNDTRRFNCFQTLLQITEDAPDVLYSDWDYLVGLLDSPNAYHRAIAVQLIAGLSPADTAQRFDGIVDRYFGRLDDDKIVVARYLVQSTIKIVRAKPHLLGRLVAILLDVDKTHHPESRKELLKADIVSVFDQIFDSLPDSDAVVGFVTRQLDSSSPSTRKVSAAFLKVHC